MKDESFKNKLGIINKGLYKNSFCIVLNKSDYIKTEKLWFYTVYKNNCIISISKNSVTLL